MGRINDDGGHQISSSRPRFLLGYTYIHCYELGGRHLNSKAEVALDRTLLSNFLAKSRYNRLLLLLLMLPIRVDKERVHELVTINSFLNFFTLIDHYQIQAPVRLAALRGPTCFESVTASFILRTGTYLCD